MTQGDGWETAARGVRLAALDRYLAARRRVRVLQSHPSTDAHGLPPAVLEVAMSDALDEQAAALLWLMTAYSSATGYDGLVNDDG